MNRKYDQIDRRVGEQVQLLRKLRSLTVSKLADKLDMSPVFIELIESGKNRASAETIFDLCDVLDVNPSDIYAFTN